MKKPGLILPKDIVANRQKLSGPAFLFWMNVSLHLQMGQRLLTEEKLTALDGAQVAKQFGDLKALARALAERPEGPFSCGETNRLMVIVSVIGGMGWNFDSTRQMFKDTQGRRMRLGKLLKEPDAAEVALLAAIQKQDTGTATPWKQAGSMLTALHAAGFAIKVDACARRIKKLRTSNRTAAKVPHG